MLSELRHGWRETHHVGKRITISTKSHSKWVYDLVEASRSDESLLSEWGFIGRWQISICLRRVFPGNLLYILGWFFLSLACNIYAYLYFSYPKLSLWVLIFSSQNNILLYHSLVINSWLQEHSCSQLFISNNI